MSQRNAPTYACYSTKNKFLNPQYFQDYYSARALIYTYNLKLTSPNDNQTMVNKEGNAWTTLRHLFEHSNTQTFPPKSTKILAFNSLKHSTEITHSQWTKHMNLSIKHSLYTTKPSSKASNTRVQKP